jgi:hypothetical protein
VFETSTEVIKREEGCTRCGVQVLEGLNVFLVAGFAELRLGKEDKEEGAHFLANPRQLKVVVFQFVFVDTKFFSVCQGKRLHGRDYCVDSSVVHRMEFVDKSLDHLDSLTALKVVVLSLQAIKKTNSSAL